MPWLPFRLMEFEIKKPVGSLARFQQASTGGKFGLTPIEDCHNEPFSLTVKSVHSKYGINNKKRYRINGYIILTKLGNKINNILIYIIIAEPLAKATYTRNSSKRVVNV